MLFKLNQWPEASENATLFRVLVQSDVLHTEAKINQYVDDE